MGKAMRVLLGDDELLSLAVYCRASYSFIYADLVIPRRALIPIKFFTSRRANGQGFFNDDKKRIVLRFSM